MVKERLKKTRYFTYMFISVWKILFFFGSALLLLYAGTGDTPYLLFKNFKDSFSSHLLNVTEVLITPNLPNYLVKLTLALSSTLSFIFFPRKLLLKSHDHCPFSTAVLLILIFVLLIFLLFKKCSNCEKRHSSRFSRVIVNYH
jgi:hypothetical protein